MSSMMTVRAERNGAWIHADLRIVRGLWKPLVAPGASGDSGNEFSRNQTRILRRDGPVKSMKTAIRSNARPTANAHTMMRLGRRPCSGGSGGRKSSRNQTRIGRSDQPAASAKSTISEKVASECERAYTEAIRAPARVFGNRTARRRERRDLSNPRSGPARKGARPGAVRSDARAGHGSGASLCKGIRESGRQNGHGAKARTQVAKEHFEGSRLYILIRN